MKGIETIVKRAITFFAMAVGIVGLLIIAISAVEWRMPFDCPDCPRVQESPWGQDSIVNTGGTDDGPYCVTAILGMQGYDRFVDAYYRDSVVARSAFNMLMNQGMGHGQKFEHGDVAFRGYLIKTVQISVRSGDAWEEFKRARR